MPLVMPFKVIALVATFGNKVSTLFWLGNIRHVLPPDYTQDKGITD